MEVLENKTIWTASVEHPVYLFYCKANICSGDTVVVMQDNQKHYCKGVSFHDLHGSFEHQNSVGKAKASGTRNCLKIVSGTVELHCERKDNARI